MPKLLRSYIYIIPSLKRVILYTYSSSSKGSTGAKPRRGLGEIDLVIETSCCTKILRVAPRADEEREDLYEEYEECEEREEREERAEE